MVSPNSILLPNRGERIPAGVNQWAGETLSRCPWCGWQFCGCALGLEFPDTWAGDLMLVAFAHRYCSESNCSKQWVARSNWAKPFESWNCPWFEPSRTEMFRRLGIEGYSAE